MTALHTALTERDRQARPDRVDLFRLAVLHEDDEGQRSTNWPARHRGRGAGALLQLDPLWDELFPAEQARIVQLLVERVDVRMHGVEVRLRPNGLAGLVREVAGSRRAAA